MTKPKPNAKPPSKTASSKPPTGDEAAAFAQKVERDKRLQLALLMAIEKGMQRDGG